jgi:hypothetical protein
MSSTDHFPRDVSGLPEARRPELVELADGEEFELRIAPVAKELDGTTVRMLAQASWAGSTLPPVMTRPTRSPAAGR